MVILNMLMKKHFKKLKNFKVNILLIFNIC